MVNTRKLVVLELIKFEENSEYSNLTLNSIILKNDLSPLDAGFVTMLFYGVIERKITLDYYISKLSSKPTEKLSKLVLNTLRVALYQIIYMDKIPSSAAVNEAVKIIKKSKEHYASGFINAILRSFLREAPKIPDGNTPYGLSVKYSCPEWFIEELTGYIGTDNAVSFLEDSLKTPPIYLRCNTQNISEDDLIKTLSEEGITAKKLNISGALVVDKLNPLKNNKTFLNGYYHIEDIASQIFLNAVGFNKGDSVLDLCAAPGGKTCTISELVENDGSVVSCDLHNHRVELIKNNANRLRLSNIEAVRNDALEFNLALGSFDAVLCDVPCSGFGVIRRKPEIKYKHPSDLTNLPKLQYNILNTAKNYVNDGGKLIYSTCTLRYDENEAVVEEFLKNNKNFKAVKTTVLGEEECYHRLTPTKHKSDGFFFCVLIKE